MAATASRPRRSSGRPPQGRGRRSQPSRQTRRAPPPSRRRRRRRRRGPALSTLLAGLLFAALLLSGCYCGWQLLQSAVLHSAPDASAEAKMNQVSMTTLDEDWVTVSLLPENQYSRPGLPLNQVNGLVIHYTGNPGTTAEQTVSYFTNLADTGETYASSHFVVGIDGTIIQCVPLNEESYCSNSRNSDTVAIECCHPDVTGAFTDETYQSLIRLTRRLCELYGLEESQVIRHYDVTGKLCPLYFVEHEDAWIDFREEVFSGLSKKKGFWPFG